MYIAPPPLLPEAGTLIDPKLFVNWELFTTKSEFSKIVTAPPYCAELFENEQLSIINYEEG